jgi:hypothetical protein
MISQKDGARKITDAGKREIRVLKKSFHFSDTAEATEPGSLLFPCKRSGFVCRLATTSNRKKRRW